MLPDLPWVHGVIARRVASRSVAALPQPVRARRRVHARCRPWARGAGKFAPGHDRSRPDLLQHRTPPRNLAWPVRLLWRGLPPVRGAPARPAQAGGCAPHRLRDDAARSWMRTTLTKNPVTVVPNSVPTSGAVVRAGAAGGAARSRLHGLVHGLQERRPARPRAAPAARATAAPAEPRSTTRACDRLGARARGHARVPSTERATRSTPSCCSARRRS